MPEDSTTRCPTCGGSGEIEVQFAHGVQTQDCLDCDGPATPDTRPALDAMDLSGRHIGMTVTVPDPLVPERPTTGVLRTVAHRTSRSSGRRVIVTLLIDEAAVTRSIRSTDTVTVAEEFKS